jgi:hypothetical protein
MALLLPRSLEAYLNDRLFQRNRQVHLVTLAKISLGDTAPVPRVIIGTQGWLYYTDGLDDNMGGSHYSDNDLAVMQKNVDHIQSLLQAQGIPLLVVLAPDKASVYPEYLPAYVQRISPETRSDQLVGYFREHASTPLLDLRLPLVAAKAQGQLYFRTDTHWTNLGGYFGWREIRTRLSAELPGMGPTVEFSDFALKPRRYSGDLARILTMRDIWTEDFVDLQPPTRASQASDPTKPRLAIFGDSFVYTLLPFFEMDFSHVRFDRFLYDGVKPNCVDFKSIEAEKPAVVIWLTLERYQSVLSCTPLSVPGE